MIKQFVLLRKLAIKATNFQLFIDDHPLKGAETFKQKWPLNLVLKLRKIYFIFHKLWIKRNGLWIWVKRHGKQLKYPIFFLYFKRVCFNPWFWHTAICCDLFPCLSRLSRHNCYERSQLEIIDFLIYYKRILAKC